MQVRELIRYRLEADDETDSYLVRVIGLVNGVIHGELCRRDGGPVLQRSPKTFPTRVEALLTRRKTQPCWCSAWRSTLGSLSQLKRSGVFFDLHCPSGGRQIEIAAIELSDPRELLSVDDFDELPGLRQGIQAPQRLDCPIVPRSRRDTEVGNCVGTGLTSLGPGCASRTEPCVAPGYGGRCGGRAHLSAGGGACTSRGRGAASRRSRLVT